MNSEELEKSLRGEFESFLKERLEALQKGVSDFQEKINDDFEKQREHLEESFRELNEKIGTDTEIEESFTQSVTEHLKLARDEGARITANAIAEAEKLDEPSGAESSVLANAIEDISSKGSQSDILKALVSHSSEFTPRGAFFIVKNEHLVGWRVFGREDHQDPKVVREVFFPVASETALSEAVRTLSTINSTIEDGEDDVMYRGKLGFAGDSKLHAIPLVARGRGVAVLYADSGESDGHVDVDAIKALMRVAGLTVEVLASAPAETKSEEVEEHVQEDVETPVSEYSSPEEAPVESFESTETPVAEAVEEYPEVESTASQFVSEPDFSEPEYSPVPSPDVVEEEPPIVQPVDSFEPVEAKDFETSEPDVTTWTPEAETPEFDADSLPPIESFSATEEFSSETEDVEAPSFGYDESTSEIDDSGYSFEADSFESADLDASDYSIEPPAEVETDESPDAYSVDVETFSPVEEVETVEAPSETEVDISRFDTAPLEAPDESNDESAGFDFTVPAAAPDVSDFSVAEEPVGEEPVVEEPVQEVQEEAPVQEAEEPVEEKPVVRSRFADRNLDLPIEVAEDERRFHNDARRFARLLVSEIKLYNEQKVKEGRESSDLYERLREAIDRSREMYDKRVQAPVAAKFDYFNYELVNTLAEGDEGRLGSSYPGPSV